MKTSDLINEIAKAMSMAQNLLKPALKDSINPHYKSKYSDISSIWEAIREPMTTNGLTIWQDVTTEEKKISVTTRIVHTSGQWVEFGPLCVPLSKGDAHGVGSAISYGKRYALCAAVGVVSGDDDDGNGSIGTSKPQQQAPKEEIAPSMKIKPELAKVLELQLKQTPEEYRHKVNERLKFLGFPSVYEIPASMFDGIMSDSIKNMVRNDQV